jgi:hypothetical protein
MWAASQKCWRAEYGRRLAGEANYLWLFARVEPTDGGIEEAIARIGLM